MTDEQAQWIVDSMSRLTKAVEKLEYKLSRIDVSISNIGHYIKEGNKEKINKAEEKGK